MISRTASLPLRLYSFFETNPRVALATAAAPRFALSNGLFTFASAIEKSYQDQDDETEPMVAVAH
jgi:hypothetical protein